MIQWSTIWVFASIMVFGELLSIGIFFAVSKLVRKDGSISGRGIFRGALERFFIFFSMSHEFFHALTLFGALKIATHIKDDDKITNDYFLIGNLVSVLLAMTYYIIFTHLINP